MFGIVSAELLKKHTMSSFAGSLLTSIGFVIFFCDVYSNYDWIAENLFKLSNGFLQFKQTYYTKSYNISLGFGICLIFVGIVQSKFYRNILDFFLFRLLSTISYSMFMWHGLLLVSVFPIAFDGEGGLIALSSMVEPPFSWQYLLFIMIPAYISSATFSYLLIERPFLLLRTKSKQAKKEFYGDAATQVKISAQSQG